MIIVNVWDAVAGSVFGHASMILPATEFAPEITVSWWPVNGGPWMFLGDDAANVPFETEVAIEGRVPERQYRLYSLRDAAAGVSGAREGIGLDDAAMRDWWNTWSLDGSYRITDRSCCTTVIAGLYAGGAREYTDAGGLTWVPPDTPGLEMTPTRVHLVCQAIERGMAHSRF
jgi:hypothetical protein